jgi:1,3-beta-glucan synthase
LITPFATAAEFAYIPTTWNNASHPLCVFARLTAGPTFYIATVDDLPTSTRSNVPLIVGMVQFFVSEVVTIAFSVIPSGRMFGD